MSIGTTTSTTTASYKCVSATVVPNVLSAAYFALAVTGLVAARSERTFRSTSFVSAVAVAVFGTVRGVLFAFPQKGYYEGVYQSGPLAAFVDTLPEVFYFCALWLLALDQCESLRDVMRHRVRAVLAPAAETAKISRSNIRIAQGSSINPTLVFQNTDFSEVDEGEGSNGAETANATTPTTPASASGAETPREDAPLLRSSSGSLGGSLSSSLDRSPRAQEVANAPLLRLVRVPTKKHNAVLKFFLGLDHRRAQAVRWAGVAAMGAGALVPVVVAAARFRGNAYASVFLLQSGYRVACCLVVLAVLVAALVAFDTARPVTLLATVMVLVHGIYACFDRVLQGPSTPCRTHYAVWSLYFVFSELPIYWWLLFVIVHNGRVRLAVKAEQLDSQLRASLAPGTSAAAITTQRSH